MEDMGNYGYTLFRTIPRNPEECALLMTEFAKTECLQFVDKVFCQLRERQVRNMILPLNELLQPFPSGMIGRYRLFLDVYTDMAFFLLDEHIQPFDEPASCLYAALKQFLYIGCIKWLSFGNQRLIGRLNGKQQILQPSVNLHCFMALTIHPALTGIP